MAAIAVPFCPNTFDGTNFTNTAGRRHHRGSTAGRPRRASNAPAVRLSLIAGPPSPRRRSSQPPARRRATIAAAAPCRLTLTHARAGSPSPNDSPPLARATSPGARRSIGRPANIRPSVSGNTEKIHHYRPPPNKSFSTATPARYPKRHAVYPSPRRPPRCLGAQTGSIGSSVAAQHCRRLTCELPGDGSVCT